MWWRPLRDLLRDRPVPPDRILHVSHWFSDHNNPRHEELLPRLERLDPYFLRIPARQPLRAGVFRAMRVARPRAEPLLLHRGARRYRSFFATDPTQAPLFPG